MAEYIATSGSSLATPAEPRFLGCGAGRGGNSQHELIHSIEPLWSVQYLTAGTTFGRTRLMISRRLLTAMGRSAPNTSSDVE